MVYLVLNQHSSALTGAEDEDEARQIRGGAAREAGSFALSLTGKTQSDRGLFFFFGGVVRWCRWDLNPQQSNDAVFGTVSTLHFSSNSVLNNKSYSDTGPKKEVALPRLLSPPQVQ